jgi:hypothetical protein
VSDLRELGMLTKAILGYEDHGILTFYLHFDFGGSAQAFGGYALGDKFTDVVLRGILGAVGVDDWGKLPGNEMWVIRNGGGGCSNKIIGIEAPAYRKNTKPFYVEEAIMEVSV